MRDSGLIRMRSFRVFACAGGLGLLASLPCLASQQEECRCPSPVKVGVPGPTTRPSDTALVQCSITSGSLTVGPIAGVSISVGASTSTVNCYSSRTLGFPYSPQYNAAPPNTCQGVDTTPVVWTMQDFVGTNGQACYKYLDLCPLPCALVTCHSVQSSTDHTYQSWEAAPNVCN